MSPTLTDTTELSTRGLNGHGLRRVQKLNDTLRRTRALVARAGEDVSQSVARLLAETRVLLLRMGRYEFGQLAGMHFHAVKNVETPGSHPQHESFSRVYRTWHRLASGEGQQPPRVRKQLTQACDQLLSLLVPEFDDHGRPLHATIDGLYRIWMYQVGHTAFEAASKKTNRQRVPLTYGTLWQRREVGMIPDFEEIRVIGTNLGRDLTNAAEIWRKQKAEQLLGRGVPQPLARFTIEVQLRTPGLRMTGSSIRRHLKVSEKTSQAISSGQLVNFSEIQHVVASVIPKGEISSLQNEWQSAWARAHSKEDFTTAFPRICEENGWTNHMIATLLKVCPPERRNGQASGKSVEKKRRTESYRPSAEVRRMYQENGFSGQVPARAAIELVASDTISEESGENQRDYLERLFLDGVEQRLLRKGSGAQGSPVRAHRILCGVTPQQLADAARYDKADILLLERGIRTVSAAETKRLVQIIESFPAQKVQEARNWMSELNAPADTISQAVQRLRDRHGGYIPLSRLLHDETDRPMRFTPGRLKRIERGDDVPTLPLLEHLVTRGGTEMTPELIRDWYERMPEYLCKHGPSRWKHPLARGFGILIFEKWHSLRRFWEEEFQEDFSYSIVTRNFQQLNGRGYDFPWSTVSRYLNAAGVGVADPRRAFLHELFHRKDDIRKAIDKKNNKEALAIVRNILKHWRKEVRADHGDPQSIEYKLGLTKAERSD